MSYLVYDWRVMGGGGPTRPTLRLSRHVAGSLPLVYTYRKNFYDSPSQEEVVESRLGRKSRGSETKFLEMD